jgi:hypothetical protein
MRAWLVAFCCGMVALGLVGCKDPAVESYAEVQITEQQARPVISAIHRYQQDHNQWPKQLDTLVPTYLPSIPKAAKDISFSYRTNDVDGYLLCYPYRSVSRDSQKPGPCCYDRRLDFWDCSPGVTPE